MKLVAATAALFALSFSPVQADPALDKAHIADVENGLIPAVVLAGRPVPTATLFSRMQATKTPAVSVAFIENGHIEWARAYGLADVASGRAATTETLFQAASISKPVSAVAALRLVQDGKLSLDEDVNARLKEWRVPSSAYTAGRKVTLRGLLSHTAGLTVHGFWGYAPGLPMPTPVQILEGAPPANSAPIISDARPGERWSYSGGGYVVAELLMTEATGRAYPGLMRDLVLKPAGMDHSVYEQPLSDGLTAQAATGYFTDGRPVPGGHFNYPELGPAGLWTTPSDLARFAIALQNAYAGTSSEILSATTAKLMLTPQMNDFGLGLNLGPKGWGKTFEHGGSNQGFQSEMRVFVDGRRQGVVIMTNGDGGQVLIGEIMRAVARSYGWKGPLAETRQVLALDRQTLSAYTGEYQISGLTKLSVSMSAAGELYAVVAILGSRRIELLAETPTHFFDLETGLTVEFVRDAGGNVSHAKIGGPYGSHDAVRDK